MILVNLVLVQQTLPGSLVWMKLWSGCWCFPHCMCYKCSVLLLISRTEHRPRKAILIDLNRLFASLLSHHITVWFQVRSRTLVFGSKNAHRLPWFVPVVDVLRRVGGHDLIIVSGLRLVELLVIF